MRVGFSGTEEAKNGGRCLRACPIHCAETVESINAHVQARLRIGALWLSAVSVIILLFAHIIYAFVYHGEVLPMPMAQVVWAIVVSPWIGEGAAKIVTIAKGKE